MNCIRSLLLLLLLYFRAAGMLQARATTDVIFGDLGITADSIDRLKVGALKSLCCS